MQQIILKNNAGTDVTFAVVRQPSGSQSAILQEVNVTAGMNRTGLAKIELSSRVTNGKTSPVASVVVPYGAIMNGNFAKSGQVAETTTATQPADAPTLSRLDASAFGRNLLANPQVVALFDNGVL